MTEQETAQKLARLAELEAKDAKIKLNSKVAYQKVADAKAFFAKWYGKKIGEVTLR